MLLRIGLLAWAFLSWPAGNSAATRTNVPDVALLDQDGRPVHFYRDLVQGRVVAIDFVFTTCKTICSLLGANFAQVEKLVDPRLASRVRLISISVDPANDTPARLKEFRARFHGSPAWRLVTGNKNDVETLLKGLGEYTADRRRPVGARQRLGFAGENRGLTDARRQLYNPGGPLSTGASWQAKADFGCG
jgi:cytochrome oxidase Cu insertion factor (SCO1/SenC/PrrC family)